MRYYVERVRISHSVVWHIMGVGEGKIAECYDPNFAYDLCSLLNARDLMMKRVVTEGAEAAAGS